MLATMPLLATASVLAIVVRVGVFILEFGLFASIQLGASSFPGGFNLAGDRAPTRGRSGRRAAGQRERCHSERRMP